GLVRLPYSSLAPGIDQLFHFADARERKNLPRHVREAHALISSSGQPKPFDQQRQAGTIAFRDCAQIDQQLFACRFEAFSALLEKLWHSDGIEHAAHAIVSVTQCLQCCFAHAPAAFSVGFLTVPLATCSSSRLITASRPFCSISAAKSVRNDFT